MTNSNGIKTQFAAIKVDEVKRSSFGKVNIAVLRQKVKTTYPASRAGNSMSDSLFAQNDFKAVGKEYINDRVTFIKVPLEATKETVQAKLDKLPDARIYRIMSSQLEDVMTDEQKKAIEEGISSKSMEEYEKTMKAINPENGQPLMNNGEVFYRALYFSSTNVEDIDLRGQNADAGFKVTKSTQISLADEDTAKAEANFAKAAEFDTF